MPGHWREGAPPSPDPGFQNHVFEANNCFLLESVILNEQIIFSKQMMNFLRTISVELVGLFALGMFDEFVAAGSSQ